MGGRFHDSNTFSRSFGPMRTSGLLWGEECNIACENSLLRQVSSLLRRLPAIESEKFQDDFLMEYNDTLLIAYLAMFTNCARFLLHSRFDIEMYSFSFALFLDNTMNELVDKFNNMYAEIY
ncbi:hypothetical protein QYF36_018089 [Acer negundo]|nr:hypothetical protein QYF36_018089 [Acer negundo]